jgi:N-formylglutamate amidohydrolase
MAPIEYYLHEPKRLTSAVVFSSPHSGRDYPPAFLRSSLLDNRVLRSSEDAFVEDLFGAAPDFGAPLIAASAPRAYVDLNRSVEDLDPAIIQGISRGRSNARVASGLGVIPRVVAEGKAIQSGKITYADAIGRLERYYSPYHARLQQMLQASRAAFGQVLLVDCHSMPSEALNHSRAEGFVRPQVVLGDRFGASCGKAYVDRIEAIFRQEGFTVTRNAPFAGAYITQTYGRPAAGQHAIQIEIDRSLYMNESTIRTNSEYASTKRRLTAVVRQICGIEMRQLGLAAE